MTTRTSDWFIIQNTESDWPQVIFFLDLITLQQQQNAETELGRRLHVNSRAQLSNNVTMNELLRFLTEIISINFDVSSTSSTWTRESCHQNWSVMGEVYQEEEEERKSAGLFKEFQR